MAKITKKAFDPQSLLYNLMDLPEIQNLYMPDEISLQYPRVLVNNDILKNCEPGEETVITRNSLSDMHLFYLKQLVYTALVPDIRVFKVVNRKDSDTGKLIKEKIIEIEFPRSLQNNFVNQDNSDDLSLARPVLDRQGQIGIKSFEWEYVGQNTFSAERDIKASMTLTMDSIGAMSAIRKNSRGQEYRILDVVIQADCFKKAGTSVKRPNQKDAGNNKLEAPRVLSNMPLQYESGCYEILVQAGYALDESRIKGIVDKMNLFFNDGPNSVTGVNWTESKIKKAIKDIDFNKMKSAMYLSVTDHTFNFSQNGKVECQINYRARSSVYDRRAEANILLSREKQKEFDAEQAAIQRRIKVLNDRINRKGGLAIGEREILEERLEEQKLKLNNVIQNVSTSFFSRVTEVMLEKINLAPERVNQDRVHLLSLDKEGTILYNKFLEDPTNLDNLIKIREKASDYILAQTELPELPASPTLQARAPTGKINPGDAYYVAGERINELPETLYNVPFVFFGDFLDAVLSVAEKEQYEDYRYILSNVKLKSPVDDKKEVIVPIGGIPIAYEVIRATLEKEIVANKRTKYTLQELISLFSNTILREAIGRQSVKAVANNDVIFKTTAFVHYGNTDPTLPEGDPRVFDVVSLNPATTRPVAAGYTVGVTYEDEDDEFGTYTFKTTDTRTSSRSVLTKIVSDCTKEEFLTKPPKILNIIVIHADSNTKLSPKVGDIEHDFKNYIPHFVNGQPYGLIKSARISKTDIPKYREQRVEQIGSDNPDAYLTNLYHAKFEMIGNDLNTLGSYIYYNPIGLAPAETAPLGSPNDPSSLSYIMGIGGFYLITRISHKMTPGNYTTFVDTRFENRGVIKERLEEDTDV